MLHRANLCLAKMLVRTRRIAIPCVVCHIDDGAGSLARISKLIRKNGLVTDQRQKGLTVFDVQRPTRRTGGKSARHLHHFLKSKPAQKTLIRQVFAKGDEVHLVGGIDNHTTIINRIN